MATHLQHWLHELQALVDDELLIYEAFPYQASDQRQTDERLLVRFRKLEHGLVLRERPCRHHSGRDAERMERGTAFGRTRMMRYFSDVSGYSGVSHLLTTVSRRVCHLFGPKRRL